MYYTHLLLYNTSFRSQKKNVICILFFISFFIAFTLPAAYDNAHFYRATHFFNEPRFEKPWLTSFDINCSGGITSTGLNAHGNTVNILEIYGPQNFSQWGAHVPLLDPHNPLDRLITQLTTLSSSPARPHSFGMASYAGTFSIVEFNSFYTQNFIYGFFTQAHIPLRKLSIYNIQTTDLTPETGILTKNTPEWRLFLQSFDQIAARYNLLIAPFQETHIGDTTVVLGWTHNYQETTTLDYIDFTIKIGVLFPTGAPQDTNKPFSLPFGYNKHWGIPLSMDLSFGCYEWLTAGIHSEAIFFFDNYRDIRMRTAPSQQGPLKLAHGYATIHQGTQWLAGSYVKADHLGSTSSLIIGYSYAHKSSTSIKPANPVLFNQHIVNNDETVKSWCMHTINIKAEYDFTREDHLFGPRIALFVNIPVSGKRIFKTSCTGCAIGLEITATT